MNTGSIDRAERGADGMEGAWEEAPSIRQHLALVVGLLYFVEGVAVLGLALSMAALDTLTAQVRSESEVVFGTSERAGFRNWTIRSGGSTPRLRPAARRIASRVLHDFRRLISTTLRERLAVPPHIVEAIRAAAVKAGVTGSSNLSVYLDERRRALQRWSDHVMSIVAGVSPPANVIALRA